MYTAQHRRQDEGATELGYQFCGPSAAFQDPSSSRHTQPWDSGNLSLKPQTPDDALASNWMSAMLNTLEAPQAPTMPASRQPDPITQVDMTIYHLPAIEPMSLAKNACNPEHVISDVPTAGPSSSSPELCYDEWLLTAKDIFDTQETSENFWTTSSAPNPPTSLPNNDGLPLDYGRLALESAKLSATSQDKAVSVSSQLPASTSQSAAAGKRPQAAPKAGATKKSRPFKKQKIEHHEESKSGKEPMVGRFRFRLDSEAPAQPEYAKTVSESERKHRQALREQGGGCVRCRIGHEKCISIGGGPCEPCLELWNNNLQSRTIVWTGCIRAKLTDVSPYIALKRDDPQKYASIWKLITTNYFFTALKSNKRAELCQHQARQAAAVSPDNGSTPIHEVTKEHKHCVFTQTGSGLDFYYAMLALHVLLHVEYDGCEIEFAAVINTAGHHALEALDSLIDFRRFGVAQVEERYGLLVCLFYGLMTMIRLRNRTVRARRCEFVFQEYKSLDIFRLHETARILGHYFVLVCERLRVPQEDWYGMDGKLPTAHGFKYVRGHCGFVSTFEDESDLRSIAELLRTLPIVQDVIPAERV